MLAFINGFFDRDSHLNFPIHSLAVNRGYGAYEFFEVLSGRPLFVERHLARFRNTLQLMRLKTAFTGQLEDLVEDLIARNQIKNAYIKILALPQQSSGSEIQAGLYMFPVHFPPFPESDYTQGMHLLMKEYQRFLPEAKSTDYLASEYYKHEMEQLNAVDVLYYSNNLLRETSRGNVFLIIDGVVFTPASNILSGVTRSIVIELIKEMNLPLEITDVPKALLSRAQEVFITSTTKQVMPIVSINGKPVGTGMPGTLTTLLIKQFLAYRNRFAELDKR
jgi:branched-subunit amino acid aminotransferase/4-amino-4-deoxychorismate lyase